ncbi:hypothetical protein BB558_004982 [Smittium angustum]|uniref:Helicase ATP-binding domain-containing protein n=1 Tax=Smittium angustum TaxID=133377 RepID=A0A2U1J1Q0_SMIAN|nr:hypothetical protein BB558_004982 [Smittium angustum]
MSQEEPLFDGTNILVLETPEKKKNKSPSITNGTRNLSLDSERCDIILESSPVKAMSHSNSFDGDEKNSENGLLHNKGKLFDLKKKLEKIERNSHFESIQLPSGGVNSSSSDKTKRKLVRRNQYDTVSIDSDSEKESSQSLKKHKSKSNLELDRILAKKYAQKDSKAEFDYSDEESENDDSYHQKADLIDAEKVSTKFFNSATIDEIFNQTTASESEAQLIINNRPYRNYAIMENTFRKTKGLRASIVNQYHDTVIGLAEIDQVINRCLPISTELKTTMKSFGLETDPKSGKVVRSKDAKPLIQSESINPEYQLKGYQLEGVSWLHCLYKSKASGILADEMGLGKTFQVIALLTKLKEEQIYGPHLIICPTSTLDNWLKEFSKFSPSLKVKSYYGNQVDRRRMGLKIEKYGARFDVMISTYNVATSNKADRALLKRIPFASLILDEGHMIKNCTSVRYTNLMQIKAKFRLLLTGTPLQNNLIELISLLAFIMPKIFDESASSLQLAFKNRKVQGKKSQQNSDTEEQNGDNPPAPTFPNSLLPLEQQHIKKAQRLLAPFVLRRRKQEVLKDLPKKEEKLIFVPMTESQKKIYQTFLKRYNNTSNSNTPADSPGSSYELIETLVESENKNHVISTSVKQDEENEVESTNGKKNIIPSWISRLMSLRKIANHPLLVRSFYDDEKIKEMATILIKEPDYLDAVYDYVLEDMSYCNDFELNYYCNKYPNLWSYKLPEDMIFDSIKVLQLKKILDDAIANDEKVLVFSGFGINLASASVVVIHDIDFNPHNDRQAEDRAHRVGQVKNVKVMKLIAKDTVEEEILEQANTKLLLDEKMSNVHLEDQN